MSIFSVKSINFKTFYSSQILNIFFLLSINYKIHIILKTISFLKFKINVYLQF